MTRLALVVAIHLAAWPLRAEIGEVHRLAGEVSRACASYANACASLACRLGSPSVQPIANSLRRELVGSRLIEDLSGAIERLKKALPRDGQLIARLESHRNAVERYRQRRNRILDRHYWQRPLPFDVEGELSYLTQHLRSAKEDLGAAEKEVDGIRERSRELDRLGRELRGLQAGLENLAALTDPGQRTAEGNIHLADPKSFADERGLSGRHNPVLSELIARSAAPTQFVLQSGEGPAARRYVFTLRPTGDLTVHISGMPNPKAAEFLAQVGKQVDPLNLFVLRPLDEQGTTSFYVQGTGTTTLDQSLIILFGAANRAAPNGFRLYLRGENG